MYKTGKMNIKTAENKEDISSCYQAMHALRQNIALADFLSRIDVMQTEKYQLIYIEDENKVVAVCGFRSVTSLYEGAFIYIDDLSTLPDYRGKGYGSALFDYVVEKAQSEGLKAIHLDSAHHRYDAHRLYLNKKMNIVYHHFRLEL